MNNEDSVKLPWLKYSEEPVIYKECEDYVQELIKLTLQNDLSIVLPFCVSQVKSYIYEHTVNIAIKKWDNAVAKKGNIEGYGYPQVYNLTIFTENKTVFETIPLNKGKFKRLVPLTIDKLYQILKGMDEAFFTSLLDSLSGNDTVYKNSLYELWLSATERTIAYKMPPVPLNTLRGVETLNEWGKAAYKKGCWVPWTKSGLVLGYLTKLSKSYIETKSQLKYIYICDKYSDKIRALFNEIKASVIDCTDPILLYLSAVKQMADKDIDQKTAYSDVKMALKTSMKLKL